MYNSIYTDDECALCGGKLEVQFRFGNVSANVYTLGSVLQWGPPEEGFPGAQRVLVRGDGVCQRCDAHEILYDIEVENDVIVRVAPSPVDRIFPVEGYVVL